MDNFRDYKFNQSQITALAIDTNNGQFLWIAYAKKDGLCLLQKVSAHDLNQVYFSIPMDVDSINSMIILGSTLYVAVTHALEAVYLFDVATPLTVEIRFYKEDFSFTESPIAVISGPNKVYCLTPGTGSGDISQIAILDDTGNYVETIDLQQSAIQVKNAISLALDTSNNIWVVTDGDPTKLYRVFFQSGGWIIDETILA